MTGKTDYTNCQAKLICLIRGHNFTRYSGQGRGENKPVWHTKTCKRCNGVRSDE